MKRVFKTRYFTRWMRKTELNDNALCDAVREMAGGGIDADIGGGVVKKRGALAGRGKSGGVRVIYFWKKENEQIYFLLIYSKSKQDNVTDEEAAILRSYVKEL